MRTSPRWRMLLLTGHVITTVGVFGTDLALLALGLAGLRGTDPRTVYPAAHLVSQWLVAPLAVASLVTGLLLTRATRWSPLKHWWVGVKAAVTLVLLAALLVVLVPGLGRAADAAVGAAPHPLTHGEQVRYVAAPAAATVLLVLNVVLGLYKPGRRRGSGPALDGIRVSDAQPAG